MNKDKNKENKLEFLIRTCLAKQLFEYVYDSPKLNRGNLLYISKNLTNTFIGFYIKNKEISIGKAIQWPEYKRNMVKKLLIGDNDSCKNISLT